MKVANVTGRYLRRLPYLRMSCSCDIAMMTEPEPRKSNALKKAWVTMWKIPAT